VHQRPDACSADGTDTVLWKYALEEHYSDQHKGQEVPAVFVLCGKREKGNVKGNAGQAEEKHSAPGR
jgi:hypothetical protein